MGLGPNRHTWSFLNLAPEAPQWCRVHHWVWVKISGDQASRQHSPEAPQLLSKHRHRRCRALLTLPALNVKLCGKHVKLNGNMLWLVRPIYELSDTFWFEMYTHHPANSFSSPSKVSWWEQWLVIYLLSNMCLWRHGRSDSTKFKTRRVSKKVLCADIWSLLGCGKSSAALRDDWHHSCAFVKLNSSLIVSLITHHLQASLGGLPSLQHSRENSDLDSDSSRVIPQALSFNHGNSSN